MSNSQIRQSVYSYESKGFNEVIKLIALHLIKTAITMLSDKELPPEVEKQREAIDSDIKDQQMIVDKLLNKSSRNASPLPMTVGVADAAAYPSCLSKARMHQDNH